MIDAFTGTMRILHNMITMYRTPGARGILKVTRSGQALFRRDGVTLRRSVLSAVLTISINNEVSYCNS
jgi:hypothetical protein